MDSNNQTPSTDKLTTQQMAKHIGISEKALTMRRLRGQIPVTVWAKVEGNILYSVSRYEDWLESLWGSLPESTLGASRSGSDSTGTVGATKKPRRTRQHSKESKPQPCFAIR